MKRNLILLLLLPALFLLVGCENPMDEHGPDAGSPTTFTATIEGGDRGTKTALGDPDASDVRAVKWSDDDAISISGATYTVSSGAGTTSATFTGSGAQLDGGKYKAYYPASVYNGGTPSLPAVQDYEVAGRIDHLPMYAEDATTTLNFRNLCAVLEFKLTGTKTVGSIGLKSTEGKKLSGAFTPQNWASDSRSVEMDASASDSVTLRCGTTGVQLSSTGKSFFIAVPAQSYTSGTLRVTVKDLSGNEITSFTNSVSDSQLERSKIYEIGKNTKNSVFQVELVTDPTTTNSTYDSSTKTITLIDIHSGRYVDPTLPSAFDTTLTFKVTTNLGYEVANSTSRLYIGNSGTTDSDPGQNVSEKTFGIRIKSVPAAPTRGKNSVDPGLTVMKPFSVSATAQVYFSPGNLQYQGGSTQNWRFAQRQWDYVGSTKYGVDDEGYAGYGTVFYDKGGIRTKSTNDIYDTDTWKVDDLRKAYDGWIDLFGWGTTGKPYRSESYAKIYPWNWSGSDTSYGPVSGDLEGDSDWGVNAIYNGSVLVPGGTYRTPSREDMEYIFTGRSDTFKYLGAAIRFDPPMELTITVTAKEDPSYTAEFTVSVPSMGVRGVILFPDNFAAENTALAAKWQNAVNGQKDWHTPITENDWLDLQAAGCVFLPFAATRLLTPALTVDCDNYVGSYWLKNMVATNRATDLAIHDSEFYGSWFEFHTSVRSVGRAVRLVKDVTP